MEKSVARSRLDTKKMVTLALMTALAYIAMLFFRIPTGLFILKYEPKDVIITIGGFMFGPAASLLMSACVSLIEMLTTSDTGPIGALMNFIGSSVFSCTAAVIYKKNRSLRGAVTGLGVGTAAMIIVMLAWNYLITPIYMGYPREAVAGMLLPVFLPFNLLKGVLNSAITILVYKPLSQAMRKADLLPQRSTETGGHMKRYAFVYVIAGFIIATCAAVIVILRMPKDGEKPAETAKFTENYAEVWFDNYMNNVPYDETQTLEIAEFPDVIFRSDGLTVSVEENGEESILFGGFPVWSVFLSDLTGDGLPELCATVSIGFGFVDDEIIVCDYAGKTGYRLSDRFNHDYYLTCEANRLSVVCRDMQGGNTVGRLILDGENIVMETE